MFRVALTSEGSRITSLQIKRMEMEARSFSPERARALLQKVKEYKADLASLRQEAKQVQLTSTCVMCLSQPYRV
jgi:Vesicle transport v-SNARE protein N-terminus